MGGRRRKREIGQINGERHGPNGGGVDLKFRRLASLSLSRFGSFFFFFFSSGNGLKVSLEMGFGPWGGRSLEMGFGPREECAQALSL